MIEENKCIFMHSIERAIKRSVANGTYKFFKSINLISNDSHFYDQKLCELTLEFLQFKIHLNLKTDYENEIFYEKCKAVLIDQKNNFNHSYQKCFSHFRFMDSVNSTEFEIRNSIVRVFSNGIYLMTMLILILFFLPFVFVIYLSLFTVKSKIIENNKAIPLEVFSKSAENIELLHDKTSESNELLDKEVISKRSFMEFKDGDKNVSIKTENGSLHDLRLPIVESDLHENNSLFNFQEEKIFFV
jgi:hypothetical protein